MPRPVLYTFLWDITTAIPSSNLSFMKPTFKNCLIFVENSLKSKYLRGSGSVIWSQFDFFKRYKSWIRRWHTRFGKLLVNKDTWSPLQLHQLKNAVGWVWKQRLLNPTQAPEGAISNEAFRKVNSIFIWLDIFIFDLIKSFKKVADTNCYQKIFFLSLWK